MGNDRFLWKIRRTLVWKSASCEDDRENLGFSKKKGCKRRDPGLCYRYTFIRGGGFFFYVDGN